MIYLACVVRGQLDPVFSFKDEHKSAKEHAYTEIGNRGHGTNKCN